MRRMTEDGAGEGLLSPALLAYLEIFVATRATESDWLPWVARLAPIDRSRLRADLAVVLIEPDATGEPIDGRELLDILREWAEIAAWDGVLIHHPSQSAAGPYAVRITERDRAALATASPAVQKAMEQLLADFLPFYPTAAGFLPRGRLKKLRERDVWQIHLPDGYRLRYVVDKLAQQVQVTYLGPHPDHDPRGRERAARSEAKRRRYRDR